MYLARIKNDGLPFWFWWVIITAIIGIGIIILCVFLIKKGAKANYNWAIHKALEQIAFNQISQTLHYSVFTNVKTSYIGFVDIAVMNSKYIKPEVRVMIDQRIQELGNKYFMNAQPFLDYLHKNNRLTDNGMLLLRKNNIIDFYNEVGLFLKWLYEGHTNQEQYIGQWDAKYISI